MAPSRTRLRAAAAARRALSALSGPSFPILRAVPSRCRPVRALAKRGAGPRVGRTRDCDARARARGPGVDALLDDRQTACSSRRRRSGRAHPVSRTRKLRARAALHAQDLRAARRGRRACAATAAGTRAPTAARSSARLRGRAARRRGDVRAGLGVDVGALDATLHLGFRARSRRSGSRRAARPPRRRGGACRALAIVVCFDSRPTSTGAPARGLFAKPGGGRVRAANEFVLRDHALCAARELPLNARGAPVDDAGCGARARGAVAYLVCAGGSSAPRSTSARPRAARRRGRERGGGSRTRRSRRPRAPSRCA